VPLLPGLAPDELRHALVDSGARTVVVGPERAGDLVALRDELLELTDLLVADVDDPPAGVRRFEDLLASAGTPNPVERRPTRSARSSTPPGRPAVHAARC
jgi:hypothetical protein